MTRPPKQHSGSGWPDGVSKPGDAVKTRAMALQMRRAARVVLIVGLGAIVITASR